MFQRCVKEVLGCFIKGSRVVSRQIKECFEGALRAFPEYCKEVQRVCQCVSTISRKFQVCFKKISMVFLMCLKVVSRMFQGCFMGISRIF